MAWQLIFTSSPRTLTAGQSGYGTVARSQDLRDALIQRLEQLSYFQHWTAPASGAAQPADTAYRILDLRGTKYHVLSRIQDAGLDFTHRTNHLAQHLIFAPGELARLPSPAVLFRHWSGWRASWSEDPRWLDQNDWANLFELPRSVPLPARSWQRVTGDAGSAAALVEQPLAGGCFLLHELADDTLLDLFAESLQLLDPEGKAPAQQWQFSFTTCYQAADNQAEFRWRACVSGSPALQKVQRGPGVSILPLQAIPAPAGRLANIARQGAPRPVIAPAAPSRSSAMPPQPVPLRLRKDPAAPSGPVAGRKTNPGWDSPAEDTGSPRPFQFPWLRYCASPRFMVPAIILTLLLTVWFTGFVWPAWFAAPKPKLPEKKIVSPSPRPLPSPPVKPAEAAKPDKPAAAQEVPKPAPPPPSPEALAQLPRQIDRVPTYLVIADASPNVELPRIPELEDLLRRLLPKDNDAPLSLDAAEGRASAGQVYLAPPANTLELRLRKDETEKVLVLENAGTPKYQISFKDWWFDPAKPMLWQRLDAQPETTVLLLQSARPGVPVTPFRLLVCDPKARPAPLQLSKTFLRANHTNNTESLFPELLTRLGTVQLPAAHRWQLRPFIGREPRDLLDDLPLDPPPAGWELNFDSVRARLATKIAKANAELEKINRQAEGILEALAKANAADLELGKRLGVDGPLTSLMIFAESRNAAPNRDLFRLYLRALLQVKLKDGKPKDRLLARFDRPGEMPGLLKEMSQVFAQAGAPGIATEYFESRWHGLGKVNDLAAKLAEQQQAQTNVENLNASLRKVPADLSGTSQIRLYVADPNNRRLLELIRFTDAPTPAP